MGKYFTWKELSTGRIPSPEQFRVVINEVRNICISSPSITDATFVGSTVRDMKTGGVGGNVRSDVDVIAIYHNITEKEVIDIFVPAFVKAEEHNIPLHMYSFTQNEACDFGHCIGPSFATHIHRSARNGGSVVGNITDYFSHRVPNDPVVDGHQYVTRKITKFRSMAHLYPKMTDAEKAHYFSKLSEAPAHAVRHWLFAKDLFPHHDSRAEIFQSFKPLDVTKKRKLEQFFTLDNKYTAFVEEIRTKGMSRSHETQFDHFAMEFESLQWSVPEFLSSLV